MTIQKSRINLLFATVGIATVLAACGGGSGGSSGNTGSSGSNKSGTGSTVYTPIGGDLSTAQYASGSVETAMFSTINSLRQQCGAQPVVENTYLDNSAVAHANYENDNNVASDTETAGLAGYTGQTYETRAQAVGYPSGISVGGGSGGLYNGQSMTNAQYATQLVYGFVAGVYHSGLLIQSIGDIGIGQVNVQYNGFPEFWAAVPMGNPGSSITNGPLTLPCDGVTGVPYAGGGETPTPPNTSGLWGTPVSVVGNPADTITLQSGTMTDAAGNTLALQVLDSANDPNKELPAYMASAYSVTPLTPNMQYKVTINGTYNGTPFTKSFTFTTGDTVA